MDSIRRDLWQDMFVRREKNAAKMELPIQTFPSESFIETESGNKISRMSVICGSQHIVLGGKSIVETGAVLRGDLRRAIASAGHLVSLAIGKYCIFRENVVLRPPYKLYKGVCSYYPAKIGDHVYMGSGTISEAASIGNCVYIGQNCVIVWFYILHLVQGRLVSHYALGPFRHHQGLLLHC